jgi:hypothetical protein
LGSSDFEGRSYNFGQWVTVSVAVGVIPMMFAGGVCVETDLYGCPAAAMAANFVGGFLQEFMLNRMDGQSLGNAALAAVAGGLQSILGGYVLKSFFRFPTKLFGKASGIKAFLLSSLKPLWSILSAITDLLFSGEIGKIVTNFGEVLVGYFRDRFRDYLGTYAKPKDFIAAAHRRRS